jgi:hypothetical protein
METPVPSLSTITDSQTLLNWFLESTPEEVVAAWKIQDGEQKNSITDLTENVRITVRRQLLDSVSGMVADDKLLLSPLTVHVMSETIVHAKRRDDVLQKMKDYRLPPNDFLLSEIKPYVVNSVDVLFKIFLVYSFQYAAIYLQVGRIFKTNNIKLDKDLLDTLILHGASLSKLSRWYELVLITAESERSDFAAQVSDVDLKERKDPLASCLPDDKLVDDLKKALLGTLAEAKVFPRALISLLQKQSDVSVLYIFVNAIVTAATHSDSLSEIDIRSRVAHLAIIQDLITLNNDWLLYWANTSDSALIR